MKTIAINFTLTEGEYELLRLGKCDKPNPQRIKMQLLHEAARNLRNMSESVLQGARGERPKPIKWKDLPAKGEPKLVLTKPVRKTGMMPTKRPMRTDGSSQPSWMDDANMRKLREPDIN